MDLMAAGFRGFVRGAWETGFSVLLLAGFALAILLGTFPDKVARSERAIARLHGEIAEVQHTPWTTDPDRLRLQLRVAEIKATLDVASLDLVEAQKAAPTDARVRMVGTWAVLLLALAAILGFGVSAAAENVSRERRPSDASSASAVR